MQCNIVAAAESYNQWKPATGISITQIDKEVIKISGTQSSKDWNYAHQSIPFPRLESGATYRLEGWMKVESISLPSYSPAFKLVVLDSNGKWVTDYCTFRYGMNGIDVWQKLWTEFKVDQKVIGGFMAIDKGTNKDLAAVISIKNLSLKKITGSNSSQPGKSVFPPKDDKEIFWPFKKSDIIAYTTSSTDTYKDYRVSFVAWGGYPKTDAQSINKYCNEIDDALKVGTKIGAKIGTRTDFAGFIDAYPNDIIIAALTKDLYGNAFIVPDSKPNIKIKGYPAYWFSTNNPVFREYMKKNAERAMQCKPHGFMMDDPLGDAATVLWDNGEYSNNGITGFREYLKANFTLAQLAQNGIPNIDTFDIKEYHQMYADLPKENRPLRKELVDFHLKSSSEMFKEVTSHALGKLGQRVPVSGNIDPTSPYSGYLLMRVDYYSFECPLNAKSHNPYNGNSLVAFKMADALGRPAALMGTGEDHAFIQDNNLPGMIRCWIAEAYAYGNYFMAPYRLWAYTPSKGSYAYQPRSKGEIAPLYQFIKKHAALFDDYQAVAPNAFVLSYAKYIKNKKNIVACIKKLADQNIPFDIIIADNDILRLHLSPEQLVKYDNLIVPDGSILSLEDAAVLKEMKKAGHKIVSNADDLNKSLRITFQGTAGIRAILRTVPNDSGRPIIVHMLNGDYDIKTDSCIKKKNFTISIPKALLQQRDIRTVKYVRPPSWSTRALSVTNEYPDAILDFKPSSDSIQVVVPHLDVWGILVIS